MKTPDPPVEFAEHIAAGPHSDDTNCAHQVAVERAICFMRARISDSESGLVVLRRISAEIGYSRSLFATIFKEITGTTPIRFFWSLRIQHAKMLLRQTDRSITDIAQTVGYSSHAKFTTVFRDRVGLTPSKFREISADIAWSHILEFARQETLAVDRDDGQAYIEVDVFNPEEREAFTFVGIFPNGIPQRQPSSGAILVRSGVCRLRRPQNAAFSVMAVSIPYRQAQMGFWQALDFDLVGSCHLGGESGRRVSLQLRKRQLTDPPLILSLWPLVR